MKAKVYSNQTIPVYYTTGTEHEDLASPESPFQGKGITTFRKNQDGTWAHIQRNGDGQPNLGYLAKEITEQEFLKWEHRISKAIQAGKDGYVDAEGHWFKGALNNTVILKSAHEQLMKAEESSYYLHEAGDIIDKLADAKIISDANRKEEYELRYQEAREFQETKDESVERPYLEVMKFKGMSLEEGAEVVVTKYEEAQTAKATVATLRMKKNLLLLDIPLAEKRKVYAEIIDGLKAL